MDSSNANQPIVLSEYHRLCMQTGHFFIRFARLEGTLSALLRLHMANRLRKGAKPKTKASKDAVSIAAAVYGSMRFAQARDTIKRLLDLEALKPAQRETIDHIFVQLGNIQAFRDQIAHQQLFKAYADREDHWYFSNVATTRSFKQAKLLVFHLDAMGHACADLELAEGLLGADIIKRNLVAKPSRFDTLPTWRYKPSMLAEAHHSSLMRPQGPAPPPLS